MATINQTGVDPEGKVYYGGAKWIRSRTADGAITPGAAVEKGTNEEDVQEATDLSSNVLGVAQANDFEAKDWSSLSEGDHPFLQDFADNEPVDVNAATGGVHNMVVASGNTVSAGDLLVCAGNGELRLVDTANDTDDALIQAAKFRALEDIDASSGATRGQVVYLGA